MEEMKGNRSYIPLYLHFLYTFYWFTSVHLLSRFNQKFPSLIYQLHTFNRVWGFSFSREEKEYYSLVPDVS